MIFSIILPTISISNLFIKSLDNLVNQDFEYKFEIIIIIDNPNLPIAEGIKNLFPNELKSKLIKIIKNKTNIGLTRSLNKAIFYANGEYLVRNDEDDFSRKDRLFELHRFLNNNNINFISSDFVINQRNIKINKKKNLNTIKLKKSLNFKNPIAHSATCFSKELFFKVGGYNEKLKVSQDFELWNKFIQYDPKSYFHINKTLVLLNMQDSSITSKYSYKQKISSILIIFHYKFKNIFPKFDYMKQEILINNILNLEDKYFLESKEYLSALVYCYLGTKSNNFKIMFNFRVILRIITIYFNYPTLFIKNLFKINVS